MQIEASSHRSKNKLTTKNVYVVIKLKPIPETQQESTLRVGILKYIVTLELTDG